MLEQVMVLISLNSIRRVNKFDKEFYLNDKRISTLCRYTIQHERTPMWEHIMNI